MNSHVDTLVLDVLRQGKALKMCLYLQQDIASTLRHYSQSAVSFDELSRLCQETVVVLNKTSRDPDLIKELKRHGQILWDHLLSRSVKERLRSSKSSNLIISLDEELITIPWELLYDGSTFLCLNYALGRLVRTKDEFPQVQYRDSKETQRMLILANPTDDLRSAYLEGLNIKNQFEHKRHNVHIDFKSTSIDKIYVKKSLSEYDLVHFAGHCEHQPNNQKNSGWVFEDGIFSIQDILAMGHGSVLPALIFSNACRSAKSGDNPVEFDCQKNNYSLAQAFLFSGVRHYIGAIRRIEDPLSFVFAKEFYSQLIAGKSVGESIRLGRLKLIKEYGISAIYWASYLLYGDPTFVLFRPAFKERRIKKGLIKYRKRLLVGICAFVLLVALSTCLFIFLPTLNPGTYYLFLKSKGLYQAGRNQEAISVLGQIIAREPLFLDAYPMLADTYLRLGERQAALKYYFDYALYSEKKEDQKSLASAYNHIGWFYHLGGDYLKAWEFYEKAISLSRQINDKLEEAIALRRQALWHIDSNQYDKAWELLIKSCEINRQRQLSYAHRFNLACDYFDLGLLFSEKDDYETAREFYKKSRATFQRLKAKDQLSDYFFNLGEIYLFEKQYQKALEYYMVGLKIDQKNGNLFSLASDYNMLGELCLAMDNLKDAEGYFIQAIQLSQRINILPCLAEGYHNLGSLYRRSGRKNQARAYLRLAQEIYAGIDQKSYLDIKKEILGLDQ